MCKKIIESENGEMNIVCCTLLSVCFVPLLFRLLVHRFGNETQFQCVVFYLIALGSLIGLIKSNFSHSTCYTHSIYKV